MTIFMRTGWMLTVCAALAAGTGLATAGEAPLPRVLPDAGRYGDVDLAAYGLPEGFMPTPYWCRQAPLQPARNEGLPRRREIEEPADDRDIGDHGQRRVREMELHPAERAEREIFVDLKLMDWIVRHQARLFAS